VLNCAVEVLYLYTNTVPGDRMRAPGASQVAFAIGSNIDMVTHEIGLDPLEMRAAQRDYGW
jgi:CO/xanthine dehydrogenase Mo-binding subunit